MVTLVSLAETAFDSLAVSASRASAPPLFPRQLRYSAIALGVNVGTMLFAGPAPAVEAALASTGDATHWLAGLFLTLTAALGTACTRLGEDDARAA